MSEKTTTARFLLTGLLFTLFAFSNNAFAANKYWIGGSGDWADAAHWRNTSGGFLDLATPAAPAATDNAIFDSNSGAAGFTVSAAAPATINDFTATGVNSCTFSLNLTVNGSFTGSTGASVFGTGTQTLAVNALTVNTTFDANSTTFNCNLTFEGTGAFIATVTGGFTCSKNLSLVNGKVTFATAIYNINTFNSALPGTDSRVFTFNNATFNVSGSQWNIQQLNGDRPNIINATNSGLFDLNDVHSNFTPVYTTLNFDAAKTIIRDSITVTSLSIDGDSLLLAAGSLLNYVDFITSKPCSNPFVIKSLAAPFASMHYSGSNDTSFVANLHIIDVSARDSLAITYYAYESTIEMAGKGWVRGFPATYYWIGNSGNWSDPAHWSKTSGGVQSCFYPKSGVNVIFDQNSFSADNSIVVMDTALVVTNMTWQNIDDSTEFRLEHDFQPLGNVTFSPQLIVNRDSTQRVMEFDLASTFNPADCKFDCNLSINTIAPGTVNLTGNLNGTDSTSIYHLSGNFVTNGYDITAKAYFALLANAKNLNLGASHLYLRDGWDTDTLQSPNYSLTAGTSKITIGRSRSTNFFRARNQTFNEVILDYNPLKKGTVKGTNTITELTITPGSWIAFEAANTISFDSLHIAGGCNKFYVDTAKTTVYELDTISVDTLSALTTVYDGFSTTNVFGFSPIVRDTVTDTLLVYNYYYDTLIVDTTITKRFISRAMIIDTIAGTPDQYHYLDSITEYVIHITIERDSIGYSTFLNFTESSDTLTGRQEVLLVSSVSGSQFNFNSVKNQTVYGIKISDGKFTGGGTQTAYFSKNVSNNTGWTFNTTQASTPHFDFAPGYCFGDTTNFINTSTAFSGSASDLIYLWDYDETVHFGDTLQYVFTHEGVHNVSLTTYYSNGCKNTFVDSVTIYKPTLFLNMDQPDTRICAGTPVEFTASAINDSMTVYQFFNNGVSLGALSAVDSIILSNIANLDSVSVVASLSGCQAEDTLSFVFQVDALPVIGLTSSDADNTICAGTNVTLTASGGNTYQFFKNGASVTGILPNTTYSSAALASSDYIYAIGTNTATQCKDTSVIQTFTVNPLPLTALAESTGGNTICAGDNVTFTASGAATYEFFLDNISQGAASAATTFSTAGLTSGQVVKVMGYSAAGCSNEAASTYSYTVNPLPVPTLAASDLDLSICQGETVTFSATGGGTYEFFLNGVSQGAATGTSTFNSTTLADNDQVSVLTSFSGCDATSSVITMDVRLKPTTDLVSNDANDTVCQLQSVTFIGTGANNYEFLINGTSVQASSPTATYSTSTLNNGYVVTLIGESNNCFVSDQITFGVLGIPNVNIISSDGDNSICVGDPITFTGTGANDYELLVDGTPGTIQASPTFNPLLTSGIHNISIRGTGANGCTNLSTNTISVNVNAFPTVTLNSSDADNTICAGTNVVFTGSGGTSYQFYVDGVSQTSMSTNNTYSNSNLSTGQVVEVRGSTAGCISSSNPITIISNPVPIVSLTSTDVDNVYCQGTNVTYTSNGGTAYEFLLDGTSLGAPSVVNTYNAASLPTGSHTLQVLGTTAGCSGSSNLNIQINGNPTAGISSSDADNTICAGNSVTFTGTGGALYEFFVNGASQGTASPLNSFSSTTLPNGATVYTAVTNATGCATNSSNINTTVNATPTVAVSSSDLDNTICAGTNVTFTGTGATTYEFFLNGSSLGAPGTASTYSNTALTNGQVVYVVGYDNGCPGTSTPITMTVYSYPAVSLSNLGTSALCSSESPNVMANGATSYQFFVDGVSQGPASGVSTFTSSVPNNGILTVQGSTNGCLSNGSNSITFTVTPTPIVNLLSSDADFNICFGQNVSFTAAGASNYEFRINNIPVQNSSSTTYSTSALENGDIVTLVGNNSQCLSNVPLLTFVVNTMDLELNANPSEVGCIGENISLTASGSDDYEFFLNGVSQGPGSANATFSSTTLNSGDSIYFIGHNNTTGCYQTLNYGFFPNVVDGSVISVDGAIPLCFGDSVILGSNHIYGNQWIWDGTPIAGATDSTYTVYNDGLYALEYTAGGNNDLWSKGYNGSGTIGDGTNLDNPIISRAEGMTDIVEISSGYDFVLARNQTGNVYAWGENGSGQLGNGTFTTTNEPNQVPTLSNIVQLATTSSSSAALTATGQIYVWGNNNYGQLGVGSSAIINFPFLLPGVTNITEIVGGKDHFVILKTDGTVWTVGNNSFGQLGTGDLINTNSFVQVTGLSNIWHIGSGENHSFAISNTGQLFVWGANVNGQLGLGDLTNRVSPALSSIPHIKDATGGANHTILTTEQKEIYVIGDNAFGQLGTTAITSTMYPIKLTLGGIKQVSTGEYSTLLLLNDSRVYASGYNAEQQLVNTPGNIASFTELTEVDGVRFIESGKRTSHFVFGGATTCNNASVDVIVNTPVVPTITENGLDLTSSAGTIYQWYRDYQLIPGATSANYTVFATGYYFVAVTDNNGCTGISDTLYFEVAGIKELNQLNVSMYPNPTRDLVTITFDAHDATCTVFDAQGKVIQTTTIISGETMSLKDVETGVYFFELKTENGNTVKRIVKN